jgi:hypothetical protein
MPIARLDLGEEFDDPRTAQSAFRGGTIFALQRVDLKGILGDVDANSDKFSHGRPPSWWRSSDHLSALRCPLGGAVHTIKGERLFGVSTLSGACVLCVLVRHLMGQLGAARLG